MSLGVAPAVILTAVDLGQRLLGANPKDKERLQANSDAYRLAVAGQQNALEFLKYRSGRFGVAASIGAPYQGGPIGGWATATARDDAFKLYQSALGVWGMSLDEAPGGGGSTPAPGHDDPPGPVQGLPGMTTMGRQDYVPLLVAGVALAVLARRRR